MKTTILLAIFMLSMNGLILGEKTEGVVVTIKPLHSLVSAVIGDTGEATLLLDNNTSPHDFQLKPSQLRTLYKSKVVFYIDGTFETFLESVFESLPKTIKRGSVIHGAKLKLYDLREGGAWEGHNHDHHGHGHHEEKGHDDHHEEKGHEGHHEEKGHEGHHEEKGHEGHHEEKGHEKHNDHPVHQIRTRHDDHGHHDHGAHANSDLHVWLDPNNAKMLLSYFVEELSVIFPNNKEVYAKNAKAYAERISQVDLELKSQLQGLGDDAFIVFHDAYQYFERAYNLKAVGSITLDPNESPSPKRLMEIRKKLVEAKVKCIFREPQFSDRLVKIVAEGSGAKSGTIDPLGANINPGADLYIQLLKDMGTSLQNGLK